MNRKQEGIRYQHGKASPEIAVFNDGRRVGTIKPGKLGGFIYSPKGSGNTGECYNTVAEVKRSLEGA